MKVEFNTEKNFEETKKALFDAFPDCTSVIFDEKKQEPSKWVSVENPPKSDQCEYVLTYGKKCGYGVEYVPLAEIMGFSLNITHWMPLSLQPPKENEK